MEAYVNLKRLVTVLYLLWSVATLIGAENAIGRVSLPLGSVEVLAKDASNWERCQVKQRLHVGDRLRTSTKSRCEITLNSGAKVRIGENSEILISDTSLGLLKKHYQMDLKSGNVWVAAHSSFGRTNNVSVRTPTAVAAIRGTTYRMSANENGFMNVYHGEVDITRSADATFHDVKQKRPANFKLHKVMGKSDATYGDYKVKLDEWVSVYCGQRIDYRPDGAYKIIIFDPDVDADDDFVKWNLELDGPH